MFFGRILESACLSVRPSVPGGSIKSRLRTALVTSGSSAKWAVGSNFQQLTLSVSSREWSLTHYHTMPHFDTLKIYSCGKHCEKRRNCL